MMEEAKGVVKHIVLAKFKDGTTEDHTDHLLKGFANLVSLIEPLKAIHWGKDLSTENLHQGFTHVFECTFESMEGVAEYLTHPAHLEFADQFLPSVDKLLIIDYKPTLLPI